MAMRVHMWMIGPPFLISGVFRYVDVVKWARLAEVRPAVVPSSQRVYHHCGHRCRHGHKARKREAVPVPAAFVDARGGETVERRRQDVHHAGGKDDASSKRLDREEDVAVRAQRGKGAAEHRHQHASRPGGEDGRDGDQLQLHRALLVRPVRGGRALAPAAGHSLLHEQEEPWEERLQGRWSQRWVL